MRGRLLLRFGYVSPPRPRAPPKPEYDLVILGAHYWVGVINVVEPSRCRAEHKTGTWV